MKDDLEISAARRPAGGGWWIDGRCGAVILTTLLGSLLFAAAFSFRNGPEAAEQAPVFVSVVTVFRFFSYAWLGCIMAPLSWVLRRIAAYVAVVFGFDLLLLAFSFGLLGGSVLPTESPFGSTALRICTLLSLALLGFALNKSLSGTFKAGVETTRRYGRPGASA